jgi:hypothetical protein
MDTIETHMQRMQAELNERNVSVRCNRALTKVKRVQQQSKDMEMLIQNYPVKVADSCPLAIEVKR